MTVWEQRIIDAFLERYPLSTAASGGRPLRLKTSGILPDFDRASPDDRESLLEAAESLERQGLVSLVWVNRRKHEELAALVYHESEALFALAGKPSPSTVAEEARCAAREAAQDPFFRFLAETLSPEDAARGIDGEAVRDLALLVQRLSAGQKGLTPRALSVALYGDSKRLEGLLDVFSRVLHRARRQGIEAPELSFLDRSFPETMIAGRLILTMSERDTTSPLINATGSILGLPLVTILTIKRITPVPTEGWEPHGGAPLNPAGFKRASVLTVENKETFYALTEYVHTFDCILYTGGHPNGAVRALISLLATSGFEFHHAGDLDPDGILILQELMEIAGKPVGPVHMDQATFEQYRYCGRELERSVLRRTALIKEATRAIPGIAALIQSIEAAGLGIEQEIIDYAEVLNSGMRGGLASQPGP
ncbi:MAG: DUF2220 domain-containing protein [Treponema sp.]|jgi:hypothetical protein|nr:DUF2220 domain-containing protein [Treponema sp.]